MRLSPLLRPRASTESSSLFGIAVPQPDYCAGESVGGEDMDDHSQRTALHSAMTTEHFVLQTANSATYSEASARSTLYVITLSSSLVAMGFVSGSKEILIPFAAIVLPALFLLGIFTVVRLVETALESLHYLDGIAHIRGYYRGLGPE